jgi:hypothetical protein
MTRDSAKERRDELEEALIDSKVPDCPQIGERNLGSSLPSSSPISCSISRTSSSLSFSILSSARVAVVGKLNSAWITVAVSIAWTLNEARGLRVKAQSGHIRPTPISNASHIASTNVSSGSCGWVSGKFDEGTESLV